MSLCLGEVLTPDTVLQQNSTVSVVLPNPRPKKASITQQPAESIPRSPVSSSSKPSPVDYDVSSESLREVIKNCDVDAVRKLLSEDVDANYCDKQGKHAKAVGEVFPVLKDELTGMLSQIVWSFDPGCGAVEALQEGLPGDNVGFNVKRLWVFDLGGEIVNDEESKEKHAKTGISVFDLSGGLHLLLQLPHFLLTAHRQTLLGLGSCFPT